ncbi:MAG: hypothetical protein HYS13_12110 [Planctomycetia bacterium]|nr:hypothetical protein [Planctomycetia bacterium]
MTSASPFAKIPGEAPLAPPLAPPSRFARFWERLDAWTAWGSEFLSPILVKETRQALKSKQFVITFSLLLICGWAWSFLGVAIIGPTVFVGAEGANLFYGYAVILLFPMVVVVPFAAYRSLAGEWEDGTYELMSISTLKATQIVLGKLGSAVVQMLVYLSALAPFMAFSYLLKGLDVVTIGWVLFWTVANSLFNTILALCLATVTRQKAWQIVFSVFLFIVTAFNFIMDLVALFGGVAANEFEFADEFFYVINGMLLTGVVGFAALFFLVARSRLLFPSDNRSTALRRTMLVLQGALASWLAWFWLFVYSSPDVAPCALLAMLGVFWWIMGAFMTGENPQLSQRVKRGLPQSVLGRMFLTWFNPGSGTGYMFALGNMVGAGALVFLGLALALMLSPDFSSEWTQDELMRPVLVFVLVLGYLTCYLGVGRLIVLFVRRFLDVGVLLTVLLQLMLWLVGELAPLVIVGMSAGLRDGEYSFLQAPSPIYTIATVIDRSVIPGEVTATLVLLLIFGSIIFLLNAAATAKELRHLRIAAPKRVQEDEARLRPRPAEPVYKSPWDEEPSPAPAPSS